MVYGLHLERVNRVPVPMTVELFMHMQWRVEKEFFNLLRGVSTGGNGIKFLWRFLLVT